MSIEAWTILGMGAGYVLGQTIVLVVLYRGMRRRGEL